MHALLGWLGICSAALAVVVGVWWWVCVWPRERRFCPGRSGRLFWPWHVVWAPRCGYDLAGVAGGCCPQCARPVRPPGNLRRVGAFRPLGTVLALSLLSAGSVWLRHAVRTGSYTDIVPTTVLLAIERPGPTRDYRLQVELDRRIRSGRPWRWQRRTAAGLMADELEAPTAAWVSGHDAQHDSTRARRNLGRLWPESRPTLERLLASARWDAVCFATDALSERLGDEPDDALIRAWVGQLASDSGRSERYFNGRNAVRATRRLMDHAEAARPYLEPALHAPDDQQRQIAAALLVSAQSGDRQEDAARILVGFLCDNHRPGDALLSVAALARAGPAARAALEAGAADADPVRAAWCNALLRAAEGVPWRTLEPALEAHRLTTTTRDPRGLDLPNAAGGLRD